MKHKTGIFLFHRDLRLDDNTGLITALRECETVIPCFILDTDQLENNRYRGDHAVQFMTESLEDLRGRLEEAGGRLFIFQGETIDILARIFRESSADALYSNADYTPFARRRDAAIGTLCIEASVRFSVTHDALLFPPGTVLKSDGTPYSIFTPFKNAARSFAVSKPAFNHGGCYRREPLTSECEPNVLSRTVAKANPELRTHGGRRMGLLLLNEICRLSQYAQTRNIPSLKGTTGLSAHHKFGTVSARETYHRVTELFGPDHPLISELLWRDFFTHIGWHFPHVFQGCFRPEYDRIRWSASVTALDKWRTGHTGFPIVDAGMRELLKTGFMHNRVRMIVASFLVKDLHLSWRAGEEHFAKHLIDYDPCVNNGNWQWAASTGCDAQPYFRIFNPWTQQKTYDPHCTYIKQWLPELSDVPVKAIHDPLSAKGKTYPKPMTDHATASAKAKMLFQVVRQASTARTGSLPSGGQKRTARNPNRESRRLR